MTDQACNTFKQDQAKRDGFYSDGKPFEKDESSDTESTPTQPSSPADVLDDKLANTPKEAGV